MSKKKVAAVIAGATGAAVAGLIGYIAYLNKKDFDEVFGMHDYCGCGDDDDDDYLYEDEEEDDMDEDLECCEEVNPDVLYAPFSKESEKLWKEFIKSRNADVKQYKDSLEYMRGHNGFGGLSDEEAKSVREMAQSMHLNPVYRR